MTYPSEERSNLFTPRRGRISASSLPLPYNPGRSYVNNSRRTARGGGRHSNNGNSHVSVASRPNSKDKKEKVIRKNIYMLLDVAFITMPRGSDKAKRFENKQVRSSFKLVGYIHDEPL